MKDEYVLYLDESEFKNSKTFAIAGIAIKKDNISKLEKGLTEVKSLVWSKDFLAENDPILHCTEFQKVFVNRKTHDISGVKPEYYEFIKKSDEEIEKIYYQVYGKISQLLKAIDATVFSCIIKLQQLQELFFIDEYHNGIHLIDDKYNIALQKIIESYTHYLFVNDGYGDVVYESRNNIGENSDKSPDIKLINVYHKIQANNKGIVYTDSNAIQSRNRTIVAFSKNENLAGLQVADFIAYNIIKFEQCNVDNQITDFMKNIHKMSYNGGHLLTEKDQRSFWGMRVLPSYLRMEQLLSSNKALKNAYNNLKKDRNKLNKVIEKEKTQIYQLKELIEKLEKENGKLRQQMKTIDIEKNY